MVAHEDPDVPLHLQEGIAAIPRFFSALYRFTRPHTMLGTFISVISVSALAVVSCLPLQLHKCLAIRHVWFGSPSDYFAVCLNARSNAGFTARMFHVCMQGPQGWTMQAVMCLMQALIPALLMNICIVGLNQIFDVPIDRVNKPYLPLASGEFSVRTGTSLVSSVTTPL